MADPVTLAMVGAAAGAALKPKNPLQGAMLGATAGFTGGTALGIGAAGSAAAGGAAAAGTAGAAGSTAANTALASQMAAQPALSYAGGNIANAAASTLPSAASNAAGLSFAGMSPSAANVANTAPSFMDKLGMAGKSAYENPMMTAQALNATQGLLTPEQQPPSAPAVPVQKGQLRDYNPMASMDPYRQSVIGGQPISLI